MAGLVHGLGPTRVLGVILALLPIGLNVSCLWSTLSVRTTRGRLDAGIAPRSLRLTCD